MAAHLSKMAATMIGTTRMQDIYKKACARKKMVVRLKNKVRKRFLNFRCVFFEFMQ